MVGLSTTGTHSRDFPGFTTECTYDFIQEYKRNFYDLKVSLLKTEKSTVCVSFCVILLITFIKTSHSLPGTLFG